MKGDDDDDDDSKGMHMAKKWAESLSQEGQIGTEIETKVLRNLQFVRIHPGLVQCNFVIPKSLSDREGNWHVGAIATVIDILGSAAIVSSIGIVQASVDFNISYYSTAKIHEEVEIEAKVMGHKGKLSSNIVEVRKKESGELIAVGKQWMTSITLNYSPSIDGEEDWKSSGRAITSKGHCKVQRTQTQSII